MAWCLEAGYKLELLDKTKERERQVGSNQSVWF